MKIFALASLLLLQGQTVFAQECCPANEAVGWKCGKTIYRCTSNTNEEPVAPVASCDEGVGQAVEVYLDTLVCAGMQSMAIEIGDDCFHGMDIELESFKKVRALSNRICVSKSSGDITKYDGDTCHSCGTTDPATTEVLQPETNADEVFVPETPVVTAEESAAVEAESGSGCCGEDSMVVGWKCGQYIYRCEDETGSEETTATCAGGVGSAQEIFIGQGQCEAMQHISLGAGCVVPGFHTYALSHRICIDSQGNVSKDDGTCSFCTQIEDYEVPPPVDPAPEEPAPEEREPAPEVALETPIEATDPPATRPPIAEPEPEEACPDDVILLGTDGTKNFPNGAVTIISQDTENVTVAVTSALSSNNVNELYYQYYETAFSEKCYSRTSVLETSEIPANDSFQVTIECTHSGNFALLEFWVVDDKLDTATNDAVIPQCCQASDEDQALGVTKFLVEVKCITSCPTTA